MVGWVNEDQGSLSIFVNQTFDAGLLIHGDDDVILTSLTVQSNFNPFFFNFTDHVYGNYIGSMELFETGVQIPIDLSQRHTYELLFRFVAVAATSGHELTATESITFTAGYPPLPLVP